MLGKFLSMRSATSVEVAMISIVAVCLPLFEAPKNVFSILFMVIWLFMAVRGRSLGSSSPFDLPILGLASILWIAPLFSDFGDVITPLSSAPRWTLLALFVVACSRLNYTHQQLVQVMSAVMVGGILAVAESIWVWNSNGKLYPEFRSVGHVNHSSMYSLIPLAVGFGAVHMRQFWFRALGVISITSTIIFLIPSKSLVGGITITIIMMLALAFDALRRQSVRRLLLSVIAPPVLMAALLASPIASNFRSEAVVRVTGDNFFSSRDKIFNSAMVVWDRHPIVGVGWFSFGIVTSKDEVTSALTEDGRQYDDNLYAHYPHGHNLWTTILIERGLLGVLLVSALLIFYLKYFGSVALDRRALDPCERCAAVASFLISVGFVVAGLGNTTMMNEHGQAGMTVIAVSFGYLRSRGLFGTTRKRSFLK